MGCHGTDRGCQSLQTESFPLIALGSWVVFLGYKLPSLMSGILRAEMCGNRGRWTADGIFTVRMGGLFLMEASPAFVDGG